MHRRNVAVPSSDRNVLSYRVRTSPECAIVNSSIMSVDEEDDAGVGTINLLGQPPAPSHRAIGCNEELKNVIENVRSAP